VQKELQEIWTSSTKANTGNHSLAHSVYRSDWSIRLWSENKKEPEKDTFVQLHCLTMIDPATGFFECCKIMRKRADYIANHLEISWLARYPWPTEIVMDKEREFALEVADLLKSKCGIHRKIITSRNPQANSRIERCHQTLANMIRTWQIRDKHDLDPEFGWSGMLAACRKAMNSTVHTTSRATPSQLVFVRDALVIVSFEADWQYIKEQKQKLVTQNNKRENTTRIPHAYNVGDIVTVDTGKQRKHGHNPNLGPYRITQAYEYKYKTLPSSAPPWNVQSVLLLY